MYELPLFPLNTVLFPGMPLHLHIFEERYRRMIGMCIQNREPFGVVLIRRGVEALGPLAESEEIGCTAHIIQVERLEQGRMNILAMGEERIRILSVDRDSYPYLVGNVENFPLEKDHPEALEKSASRLRIWVNDFIQTLVKAGGDQFDTHQLPDDPVKLAFLAAAVLHTSPVEKQALLSINRADDLIDSLQETFRREVAILKATISIPDQEGQVFSRN